MTRIDDMSFDLLLRDAHTFPAWLDTPVDPALLHQIYDMAKWGPTSMNCCPLRISFISSPEAKAKLKPCLSPGNVDKTMQAPVTALFAYDREFYEHMARLWPQVMGELEAQAPHLHSFLSGSTVIGVVGDDKVRIALPSAVGLRMAEQPDNARGVEAALSRLAGRSIAILMEQGAAPSPPASVNAAPPREASSDHRTLLEDIKAQFDAVEEPGR